MPNRTVCAVLDEIRALDKTKNYSSLLSLIEETQFMVNRMESKLYDMHDHERLLKEIKRLEQDVKRLRAEKSKLKDKDDKDEVPF